VRREHESIIGTAWAKAGNHGVGERHGMVTLHFHPLARNNPHTVFKIEFARHRAPNASLRRTPVRITRDML
jgi:hypothetical protein